MLISNIITIPLNLIFGKINDRVHYKFLWLLIYALTSIGCLLILLGRPLEIEGILGACIFVSALSVLGLINFSTLSKLVKVEGRGPIFSCA